MEVSVIKLDVAALDKEMLRVKMFTSSFLTNHSLRWITFPNFALKYLNWLEAFKFIKYINYIFFKTRLISNTFSNKTKL